MELKMDSQKTILKLKGKRIAVLYGGLSDERDVSLRSGKNVFNALKQYNLDVELIDFDRDIVNHLQNKKIDYVFNTLHGTYGEDGIVQGILELLRIPYTGENAFVSALSMNKPKAKEIWLYNGICTPRFSLLSNLVRVEDDKLVFKNESFCPPFVLKPVVSGSSINVFIIKNIEQFIKLKGSLDLSNYFIEEFISGKEVTVGVTRTENGIFTFPILGINPKKEFYDYEAKYTKGMTDFEMPAKLPEQTRLDVIEMVEQGYSALGCEGVCRIDVIVCKETGKPYLIENNTQPGMTDTSDIPQMLSEVGVSFPEFILYVLGRKVV